MENSRFSSLITTFLIVSSTLCAREHNHHNHGRVGISNGLSVTVGEKVGQIMPLRAELRDGYGNMHLDGWPGKEFTKSAKIAFEYAQKHAVEYGVDPELLDQDLYMHLPNYPIEGDSAGTALLAAMMSAYTGRPVDDSYALTGAINKHGRVLPIGELKAKMKGAREGGVNDILAPVGNYYNYKDAGSIKKKVEVEFVQNVREVLDKVLL